MKSSVILSAYCGSDFLSEQMETIINQTRSADEIILIDDCSPDGGLTQEIIEYYSSEYSNVFTYKNERNLGWAASFINGIKYAKGDVLFFSDQDDVWALEKIEKMMYYFESDNINGLISDVETVDINLNANSTNENTGKLISNNYPFNNGFINSKVLGSAMAVRKPFIERYISLWNNKIAHDRFCQMMLMLFDRLYFLDLSLVKHRLHGNNASRKRGYAVKERIDTTNGNIEFLNKLVTREEWERISEQKKQVIRKCLKFECNRLQMLESRSLIKWAFMPAYKLSFYPRKRTWLGDLLAICKK